MWTMIKFPFKAVAFILSPFTGYNPFKRVKKGDLPNKIYQVRFSLALGFGDEKALCKGIEKALGLDMCDILREVNGLDISRKICRGNDEMWEALSTPLGIILFCQDEPETQEEGYSWANPRTPQICVDGETLARMEASKAIVIYSREDITSLVYKVYRDLSRKDYLLEATRIMIQNGDCSDECEDCQTSFYVEGLDPDGDCPNCGCYEMTKEDLEIAIDRAEREAA